MNALALSLAYLRRRPLNTVLNLLLLAIGVGTISLLLLFSDQLQERLARDAQGVDMVVGAKGSPMQLILSSVFHIDVPTGNVRIADARPLTENRMIEQVIPLALGDSFRGFRIVGTERAYADNYSAELAEGAWWQASMEATVGSVAAAQAGLGVGTSFVGSHGLAEGGAMHGEHPYRVVGVMAPTGTVLDRVILVSVESVWDVHEIHHGGEAEGEDHDAHESAAGSAGDGSRESASVLETGDDDLELTALLVRFRNPIGAATMPRQINMTTPMQAALPGYEIARLMQMIGIGLDGFRAFAAVLVVSAGLGIFTALYNALAQRRYDIAVMRSLGASRGAILRQILLEGTLLAFAGGLLGLILGHAVAEVAGAWLWREHQIYLRGLAWDADEGWLAVMALLLGAVAALLPALQAYRIDISRVLARG
ncbi:MAG TPA: ABC transporter permease [Alphaproteobacteria bacterium]